jgi:hypothetical protein
MRTGNNHSFLLDMEIRTEEGGCWEKVGFDFCIALATKD